MAKSDSDEGYRQSKEVAVSDEEFVDDDNQTFNKKQKVEKTGEKRKKPDTDGNYIFELSTKRRVTVRLFSTGEPSVDVREFYKDKVSGEMRPGKSGICFPLAQWKKLKELIGEIDEAIETIKKD
ncbi:transcriptional Coactivator p15-domain-containing protein [Sporodiniella umbellata]|nr:transcriptional Coactivator p15-domain-containing protein [Sporodiniella umbellata]